MDNPNPETTPNALEKYGQDFTVLARESELEDENSITAKLGKKTGKIAPKKSLSSQR